MSKKSESAKNQYFFSHKKFIQKIPKLRKINIEITKN